MTGNKRAAIAAIRNMSCEERCLWIIAKNSPLFRRDPNGFYNEVVKNGAELGDVEISNSKADRQVRREINSAVGSKHPPGSFMASTDIDDILIDSCLGG